jgi:hypothetical protein
LAVYVAAYLVLAALTAALFVFPRTQRPAGADVIVVPQGEGPRVQEALRLAAAGMSPVIAIAAAQPGTRPCPGPQPDVEVVCFRPQPYTTQGEARWIAMMARQRGWHRVLVLVSNTQAIRARIRIRRCYEGGLRIVAVTVNRYRVVDAVFYEWGALLKALILQRGC